MTLAEFAQILESTGLPVAYQAFEAESCPDMPFIVYEETGSNNFSADGVVYKTIKRIQVDLFSSDKNITAETKIEAAFQNAVIFWQKVQTTENAEACIRYTYEVEI